MFSITKKYKLFIIITVVALLIGFVFLGVFGFNNGVDFKKDYEVSYTITKDVEGSKQFAKDKVETFFKDKGVADKGYACQSLDEGLGYIYKFDNVSLINQTELKDYLQNAIDVKYSGMDIEVSVAVDQVLPVVIAQAGWIILALGLAVVAGFIFLLISQKLAAALASVIPAMFAACMFVALAALCRIPAAPFIGVGAAISFVIAFALSAANVCRYKEEYRLNEKITAQEVADKGAVDGFLRYCFIFVGLLVISLLLIILGSGYVKFFGLHILVASISGVYASFVGTPLLYTALKKVKIGKKGN